MEIDINAPLSSAKEIHIEAPLENVWTLLTDIEKWTDWQPDITSAKLEGPLVAASVFRWKAKGLSIVSTLHTVEPQHEIGWSGVSPGMFAIHNWTMETAENGTRVVTKESLTGWFARLLKIVDPHFLDKSLETILLRLKAQIENL
ncbi:MAG: hypothetical protein BGO78_05255 [Chloroflexi bacterium 44-23]|nr:MAG: hypothetical protein BGO78_05255 [Chloroflexi bacterium 44-23]